MDQRMVLDEKSFKALSADSRVSILKNLTDRRRTLTELSQKLNLGGSTIKEHCDILVNAELIKQIDEGRKWKYYELTQKGKQIIQPNLFEEVKVLIVLSLATIFVAGFVYLMLGAITPQMSNQSQNYINDAVDQTIMKSAATTTSSTAIIEKSALPIAAMDSRATSIVEGITTEFFLLSITLSLIVGMLLGWIFTRRN